MEKGLELEVGVQGGSRWVLVEAKNIVTCGSKDGKSRTFRWLWEQGMGPRGKARKRELRAVQGMRNQEGEFHREQKAVRRGVSGVRCYRSWRSALRRITGLHGYIPADHFF